MFFINGLDPEQRERAERWYGAFYPEIIRRGCCMYAKGPLVPGTIYEVQGPAYELTMRIKSLLDPNNIMNPGIL
jgi:FAD/FMN-containing dehydrogenase